jgi:hypothetical protein
MGFHLAAGKAKAPLETLTAYDDAMANAMGRLEENPQGPAQLFRSQLVRPLTA